MMHYSHPNIIVIAANDNMVLLQGGGGESWSVGQVKLMSMRGAFSE